MDGDVNELLVTLRWAQSLTKQLKKVSKKRTITNALDKCTKETLVTVRKFCYEFDSFLNNTEDESSDEDEKDEDTEVEDEETDVDEEEVNSNEDEEDDEDDISIIGKERDVASRLVILEKELRRSISISNPDHQKALKVLQDMQDMTITPAVVKESYFIISTLRKTIDDFLRCHSVHPHWTNTDFLIFEFSQENSIFKTKAYKRNPTIMVKAEQLYYRLTGRFEEGFSQLSQQNLDASASPQTTLPSRVTRSMSNPTAICTTPPDHHPIAVRQSPEVSIIDLCSPSQRPSCSTTVSDGIVMDDDLDECLVKVSEEIAMMDDDLDDCLIEVDLEKISAVAVAEKNNKAVDDNVSSTPKVSPLCKCDDPSVRLISNSVGNPNRPYYVCAKHKCNFWVWESDMSTVLTVQGPRCQCGQPSVQRYVDSTLMWVCANPDISTACTWQGNCDEDILSQVPRGVGNPGGNLPGDVEFLVSGPDRTKLQKLFKIPAFSPLQLQHTGQTLNYDDLKVEVAWKVVNQVNLKRFTDHNRSSYKKKTQTPIVFSTDYQTSVNELTAKNPLDPAVNEVLLLHATAPENVYPILFEGLDAGLARGGLYGRGVYFSDEGAKVNQYARIDAKDETSNNNHRLQKLHKKLYGGLVKHPGDIYYAFVCRVVLGKNVVVTNKGRIPFKTRNKDSLKNGKHSLQVTRTGSQLHREFVVFDSRDVHIDYLVAFKRCRTYCQCGVEGTVKGVVKRTVNHGRQFFFCGMKPDSVCDDKLMFPLCHCGSSASVLYRDDTMTKYGCGYLPRYSRCVFHKETASVTKGNDLWKLEVTVPTYGNHYNRIF